MLSFSQLIRGISKFSKPDALTPKNLYKYLMNQCRRLPDPEIQKYYKHHVRQSFNQHSDETEAERVQQIMQQAVKDFDWVLKKYKVEN